MNLLFQQLTLQLSNSQGSTSGLKLGPIPGLTDVKESNNEEAEAGTEVSEVIKWLVSDVEL